ncbi:TlpA disulfide reductase family protein [Roseovarius pacificus]|uniref:TlpA disulfide reductase family protein n=1 Tax=Roseovarius pacificus TaxID=337701 RepID=UPI002A18BB19|nr:TlpA disulfide reductase family protein [Roseovarius pacificus]
MNAIELGPFVFATERFAFLIAALVFFAVFHLATIRRSPEAAEQLRSWAFPAAVSWLLAARAGYVMQEWDVFSQHPLDILKLWQGGVSVGAGFFGLAAVAAVALLRRRAAMAPMLAAALAGWMTSLGVLALKDPGETAYLPQTAFPTMAGGTVQLDRRNGTPLVLNLWASWCPPCRREMPMMMDVANTVEGAELIFANQGETRLQVARFLDTLELGNRHVSLDPTSSLMSRFEAMGLPSTLFFDASGSLQYVHFGEISRAALMSKIAAIKTAAPGKGDSGISETHQTGDTK